MKILDYELPSELLAFKADIEASIKPYIEIKAKLDSNVDLRQSKFGGFPYLPKDCEYPRDAKGDAMFLLAQINFAETPKLEFFPKHGVLQFYISGGDDIYGICFEDMTSQKNFRVLYFPEILEDESRLVTDFSFLPKFNMLPLQKTCSLTFSLRDAPISVVDYQFEPMILGQNMPASKEDLYKIYDVYGELFQSTGHKIGGYPDFTQSDPRMIAKYKNAEYILLFQMDTDGEADIIWGDLGVGNFFILPQHLEPRDFSEVLYNWDCY